MGHPCLKQKEPTFLTWRKDIVVTDCSHQQKGKGSWHFAYTEKTKQKSTDGNFKCFWNLDLKKRCTLKSTIIPCLVWTGSGLGPDLPWSLAGSESDQDKIWSISGTQVQPYHHSEKSKHVFQRRTWGGTNRLYPNCQPTDPSGLILVILKDCGSF